MKNAGVAGVLVDGIWARLAGGGAQHESAAVA
jgi:hypothetical protein